jgi:hypothetical protein
MKPVDCIPSLKKSIYATTDKRMMTSKELSDFHSIVSLSSKES